MVGEITSLYKLVSLPRWRILNQRETGAGLRGASELRVVPGSPGRRHLRCPVNKVTAAILKVGLKMILTSPRPSPTRFGGGEQTHNRQQAEERGVCR